MKARRRKKQGEWQVADLRHGKKNTRTCDPTEKQQSLRRYLMYVSAERSEICRLFDIDAPAIVEKTSLMSKIASDI